MRPIYQTEADAEAERKVALYMAERWRFDPVKNRDLHPIDWCALNAKGYMRCWLEIKCREISSTSFSTLILSQQKWEAGMDYMEESGIPYVLAYSLKDGIYYLVMQERRLKPRVHVGGRLDRGDPKDLEPLVHLPTKLFRKL